MNDATPLLGLLGLGTGVGFLLVLSTWRRQPSDGPRAHGGRRKAERGRREHAGHWLAAAAGAGLVTGAFTGWVIGGLLAAMAAWSLPGLYGSRRADQQRTEQIEGIAGWAEMLRDTLAAAAGLEQAIAATAHTAPQSVRPHIEELAVRIERGDHLPPALRRLAQELDDPTADLVLAALILASEHQARQLGPLLGELAATARAQVEMRQRVEAGRTRVRTTMRVVVTTTLSFAAALVLFNPTFLSPYDTLTGQLVLLAIGALFTAALTWLRRMARIEGPERFLTPAAALATTEPEKEGRATS